MVWSHPLYSSNPFSCIGFLRLSAYIFSRNFFPEYLDLLQRSVSLKRDAWSVRRERFLCRSSRLWCWHCSMVSATLLVRGWWPMDDARGQVTLLWPVNPLADPLWLCMQWLWTEGAALVQIWPFKYDKVFLQHAFLLASSLVGLYRDRAPDSAFQAHYQKHIGCRCSALKTV